MDEITPIIYLFLKIELVIVFVFLITNFPDIKKDGCVAVVSNMDNKDWLIGMSIFAAIAAFIFSTPYEITV